jgi:hypothetical protein
MAIGWKSDIRMAICKLHVILPAWKWKPVGKVFNVGTEFGQYRVYFILETTLNHCRRELSH